MRKLLTFILLSLVSLGLSAQTDSLRLGYVVRGQVRDARTGKALESVHVSVPGKNFATVTNADGEFVLKSDAPFQSVECSFLGYRNRTVAVSDYMRISLQQESIPLKESSIVSGDPVAIVRAAIENAEDNYCPTPELLQCFYRETLQKRNRYTYVAEAVTKVYKDSYRSGTYRDASALVKSRVLVSQRSSDTLSVKTQGGPNMAVDCDFLKIPDFFLSEEEMVHYLFTLEAPAYIDDRLQFVVKMSPHPLAIVNYALYYVTLYIDRETLAFTRIEAALDVSDRSKATRALLVSKPLTLRFFPEEASIVINFSQDEGRIRMQYFRATIRFACDWKKRLLKTHYTTICEMVVTDIYTEAVQIGRKERFRHTDILDDMAPRFADPDFWADYNIIAPSESLEHALSRLRRR